MRAWITELELRLHPPGARAALATYGIRNDTAASVIVRGRARVLEGDEVYRAESLPLRPWVPTMKNVVVEIEPTELSGRRFRLLVDGQGIQGEGRRRGERE